MSTKDLLTVRQAATIRRDGGVELVTHNVSIQPDQYTFANFLRNMPTKISAYRGTRGKKCSIIRLLEVSGHRPD